MRRFAPTGAWTEATTPGGERYWYHTTTRESSGTDPTPTDKPGRAAGRPRATSSGTTRRVVRRRGRRRADSKCLVCVATATAVAPSRRRRDRCGR